MYTVDKPSIKPLWATTCQMRLHVSKGKMINIGPEHPDYIFAEDILTSRSKPEERSLW